MVCYIYYSGEASLVAKCCGLRVAVCGLQSQVAVVVATCDSGRRLLSENKRKGAKSGCALLFLVVYCSEMF
jgi:hypothetical protein